MKIRIHDTLVLFLLLVATILSGLLFKTEPFISSSPTHKGVGIGDRFAAPLDLTLNTDTDNFNFIMPGIFN